TGTCVEFDKQNLTSNWTVPKNATSPTMEFWERRVLKISGGIEEVGSLHWEMTLCLLLAWIICYFCVWKGVKSTGKVVYFTATFPYLMLVILLIRGLTLPRPSAARRSTGPGLAFIAYPRAVAMMPLPQLWACCFFLMVILLGMDSQFVGLESLTTAISDMRPAFFQQGSRRKLLLLFICVSCFFVGLLMVTEVSASIRNIIGGCVVQWLKKRACN
ncbi:UNVERIFIED_CONTAM: hypothetical protein FKN15_035209, partial [Acipenser sinensis]